MGISSLEILILLHQAHNKNFNALRKTANFLGFG